MRDTEITPENIIQYTIPHNVFKGTLRDNKDLKMKSSNRFGSLLPVKAVRIHFGGFPPSDPSQPTSQTGFNNFSYSAETKPAGLIEARISARAQRLRRGRL